MSAHAHDTSTDTFEAENIVRGVLAMNPHLNEDERGVANKTMTDENIAPSEHHVCVQSSEGEHTVMLTLRNAAPFIAMCEAYVASGEMVVSDPVIVVIGGTADTEEDDMTDKRAPAYRFVSDIALGTLHRAYGPEEELLAAIFGTDPSEFAGFSSGRTNFSITPDGEARTPDA